jgi:hypothetical protein
VTDYRALLHELAVPRLVGSAGHARVREVLKRELARRGFTVGDGQFGAAPASLRAVGLGGVALALIGLAGVAFPAIGEPAVAAWIAGLGAGLLLSVAVFGRRLLTGMGLSGFAGGSPFRQGLATLLGLSYRHAATLIAMRPSSRVTVWLVAHYDAKGQPISMATRLYAVALAATAVAALGALAAAHFAGVSPGAGAWIPVSTLALLGGGLLAANPSLGDSPGAVDNASGIIAALAVVDRLPVHVAVGVLLPDAEEFGLVGATSLVEAMPDLLRDTAVVNFDGIDDHGGTVAIVHRPGPVVEAVVAALGARRFRMLPVLVDGLVLAPAARECVTILRGDWNTARIVHTKRDTPDRLTLEGVREVAERVAGVVAGARQRETGNGKRET